MQHIRREIETATARARGYLGRGMERISRREALVGAAAVAGVETVRWAVGETASRVLVDPALERPPEPARSFFATPLSPERFDRDAGPVLRKGLALIQAGAAELPADVMARTTVTYPGADGRQMIRAQGDEIGRLLQFGGAMPEDTPMAEQPDRAFGRWAERRVIVAQAAAEPVYAACWVVLADDTVLTYTALLARWAATGAVVSMTQTVAPVPGPRRPRPSPATGGGRATVRA